LLQIEKEKKRSQRETRTSTRKNDLSWTKDATTKPEGHLQKKVVVKGGRSEKGKLQCVLRTG